MKATRRALGLGCALCTACAPRPRPSVGNEPVEWPDVPLLEYDPVHQAVIDPLETQSWHDCPEVSVACFLPEAVARVFPTARNMVELPSLLPLWEVVHEGQRLGIFYPGQGEPLAATTLERVIAGGCRAVVARGGAGTIAGAVASGQVVIVDTAVRDEGTSFHYLPPGREVRASPAAIRSLQDAAGDRNASAVQGKAWTTDALFRQTSAKLARRAAEGCVVVDMEAASMLAVGEFRSVPVGVCLSAGDQIDRLRPGSQRIGWCRPPRRRLSGVGAELPLGRRAEGGPAVRASPPPPGGADAARDTQVIARGAEAFHSAGKGRPRRR
jgi:uridine phosphorylase